LKTTDEEREVILAQNDQLRNRFRISRPETFQRLRRCCICLQASCADQGACRAEFAAWATAKWDTAVREECLARGESPMDEAGIAFVF
jgi:hypothetical protein